MSGMAASAELPLFLKPERNKLLAYMDAALPAQQMNAALKGLLADLKRGPGDNSVTTTNGGHKKRLMALFESFDDSIHVLSAPWRAGDDAPEKRCCYSRLDYRLPHSSTYEGRLKIVLNAIFVERVWVCGAGAQQREPTEFR